MLGFSRQHALTDQVLSALDARTEAIAVCEVASGVCLPLEAQPAPLVHYVLAGSGEIQADGGPAIPIADGSIVILPSNFAHALHAPAGGRSVDAAPVEAARLAEGIVRIRAGGDRPAIVTACGLVHATYGEGLELFAGLAVPITAPEIQTGWLTEAFHAVLNELAAPRVGTQALLDALLKQCLILVLRQHIESGNTAIPWLSVLSDSRMARPLATMLAQPAAPFSLLELARIAGMSRSAFALRFVATFGETPMNFLGRIRLSRAARLLEATDLPIKAIAQRTGYASRSHFSRAFRSVYAADPTAFRTARRPPSWPTMDHNDPHQLRSGRADASIGNEARDICRPAPIGERP